MVRIVEGPARGLKVAVVGGSIAGCTMAIELLRVGCDVTLFERTGEELKDRGAGIAIQPSVIDTLVRRDLVDPDMPFMPGDRALRIWRTEREPRFGYLAWAQPSQYRFVNWGHLYANLRKRLPDEVYRTGQQVVALHETADSAVGLELAGGASHEFQLVVFADGYRSLGRQRLFPEVQPRYAGYVLWRGALAERVLEDSTPLEGVAALPGFAGGNALFYLVAGMGGSVEPGRRMVNWGIYTQIADLEEALTDRNGRIHAGSLPPGMIPAEREAALVRMAREVLPSYYAEIVENSVGTSIHAVFDCTVPAYRRGRVCLTGDAGALSRPHSGSGALKGMSNAVALGEALRGGSAIDEGLDRWSAGQTALGNRIVEFGRQLGRALVTEIPDWSRMDPAGMEKWFGSVVTVPSETFQAAIPRHS